MAFCDRCGDWFDNGGETWKTLCLSCWKRKKRTESDGFDPVAYWKERALRAESTLDFWENSPAPVAALPADLADHLKTLIFLCHPDKHGNDPRATAATQYLLGLRELLK